MDRRGFLVAGSLGSLGWLGGCGGSDGGGPPMMGPANPPAAVGASLPEGAALRDLARLANTATEPGLFEATLAAAPQRIALGPGLAPEFWSYNGASPGPLIEVAEGSRVRIRFDNRLPGQDSTIHWHGLAIPAGQDGNPMDPVASGASRTYEFTIPEGCAGTYWYHPHPHRVTHEQVFRGLAGLLVVRARADPLSALAERALVVTDLGLDATGAIAANTPMDFLAGREGGHLLVNGAKRPLVAIAPGETQRWRVLNATNARYLRLAIPGNPFTLVGTDGGLVERPVAGLAEILLAPAERVELLVTGRADGTVRETLYALAYDRGAAAMTGMMGPGASVPVALATLEYREGAAVPWVAPEHLREIGELGEPVATQRAVLTRGMGTGMGAMGMGFAINGRSFDAMRTDFASRAGAVELWEIANLTAMDHPMHLHGTQFQVVARERSGRALPLPPRAWKDTVNVAAGETVRFKAVQAMPGRRLLHCHILEHEDAGMMATVDVA